MSELADVAFAANDDLLVLEPRKNGFDLLNLTQGEGWQIECACIQPALSGDGSRMAWLEEEDDYLARLRIASATDFKVMATLTPLKVSMRMAAIPSPFLRPI